MELPQFLQSLYMNTEFIYVFAVISIALHVIVIGLIFYVIITSLKEIIRRNR
jgi:hypothetical protein